MAEDKTSLTFLVTVIVILIGIPLMVTWIPWAGTIHGMMGMMGYGWGFMFLTPLAFLALTALGAYYLVTGFTGTGRPSSGDDKRALEILKERYAKGEITREQYLSMREEVES